jgi:hypothetical protein
MDVLSIDNFSIKDQLRIQVVKRWHIVSTSNTQTVADHTCGVMLLGRLMISEMDSAAPSELYRIFYEIALNHDILEVLTGDIPSPAKKALAIKDIEIVTRDEFTGNLTLVNMAHDILKICDLMESVLWIGKWKVGDQGLDCYMFLRGKLEERISALPESMRLAAASVWTNAAWGNETLPQDLMKFLEQ